MNKVDSFIAILKEKNKLKKEKYELEENDNDKEKTKMINDVVETTGNFKFNFKINAIIKELFHKITFLYFRKFDSNQRKYCEKSEFFNIK